MGGDEARREEARSCDGSCDGSGGRRGEMGVLEQCVAHAVAVVFSAEAASRGVLVCDSYAARACGTEIDRERERQRERRGVVGACVGEHWMR
jgi:hypothetical protein